MDPSPEQLAQRPSSLLQQMASDRSWVLVDRHWTRLIQLKHFNVFFIKEASKGVGWNPSRFHQLMRKKLKIEYLQCSPRFSYSTVALVPRRITFPASPMGRLPTNATLGGKWPLELDTFIRWNLVHRDIKPQNIVIAQTNGVLLNGKLRIYLVWTTSNLMAGDAPTAFRSAAEHRDKTLGWLLLLCCLSSRGHSTLSKVN